MTSDQYHRLQQFDDAELLNAIAFDLLDYEKGAQEVLFTVLAERKLSQQDVVEHRKSELPQERYSYKCLHCDEPKRTT